MKTRRVSFLILLILYASRLVQAQSDPISAYKNNDTLQVPSETKTKLSFGYGFEFYDFSDERVSSYSLEYLYTTKEYIAIGGGLDLWKNQHETSPSLNFYVMFNYSPFKKNIAELYIGPGFELGYGVVGLQAMARVDLNILKNLSVGVSFKQPIGTKQGIFSSFKYHIVRFNISANIF